LIYIVAASARGIEPLFELFLRGCRGAWAKKRVAKAKGTEKVRLILARFQKASKFMIKNELTRFFVLRF